MMSIVIPSKNEPNVQVVAKLCHILFPDSQIIISHDPYGRGKGWAIREGVRKAHGNYIAFLDGDMDIHPAMLYRLIPFIEEYDVVVGEKRLSGSWQRKLLTACSRLWIKLLFGLEVETQTGIKLFKTCVLQNLWDCDGFAFDIEVLSRAKKAGYSMIGIPVIATPSKKMPLSMVFKAFSESIRIKKLLI